jgi:hypothetical protein
VFVAGNFFNFLGVCSLPPSDIYLYSLL